MRNKKKPVWVSPDIFGKIDGMRSDLERSLKRKVTLEQTVDLQFKSNLIPSTIIIQKKRTSKKKKEDPFLFIR